MDLEQNTFLLVERIEPEARGLAAYGWTLGMGRGFGAGNERGFAGRFRVQSVETGAAHVLEGEVSEVHTALYGYHWLIEPAFPELLALPPPFILTSRIDLVIAARYTVTIALSDPRVILSFDAPAPVITEDRQYLGFITDYAHIRRGSMCCTVVLFGLERLTQRRSQACGYLLMTNGSARFGRMSAPR